MTNIPKDIARPMNPYAETDFDNAVDNALAEMQRLGIQLEDSKTAMEKHENSITMVYRATEEWMSIIKILVSNGYHFEVHPYEAMNEVLIVWGDK